MCLHEWSHEVGQERDNGAKLDEAMVKEQILKSVPVACDSNDSHDHEGNDDQTYPNRKVGYGHHPSQVEARFSLGGACHKEAYHKQQELKDAQAVSPYFRGVGFLIHLKVVKDAHLCLEISDEEWG